jgi:hypothetical protein
MKKYFLVEIDVRGYNINALDVLEALEDGLHDVAPVHPEDAYAIPEHYAEEITRAVAARYTDLPF